MTSGAVRLWLRAEGLTVFVLSVWLYARGGFGWGQFAWLLLVPDVSFAGYVGGPRIGAWVYNAAHSYVVPLQLVLVAGATGHSQVIPIVLIWTAHIGLDRVLGFGLKYPTAFGDTHLGRMGGRSDGPDLRDSGRGAPTVLPVSGRGDRG